MPIVLSEIFQFPEKFSLRSPLSPQSDIFFEEETHDPSGYRLVISLNSRTIASRQIAEMPSPRERTREDDGGDASASPKRKVSHMRGRRDAGSEIRLLLFYFFLLPRSPHSSRICPRSARRRAVVPSAISSQINQTFESRSSPRPPRRAPPPPRCGTKLCNRPPLSRV